MAFFDKPTAPAPKNNKAVYASANNAKKNEDVWSDMFTTQNKKQEANKPEVKNFDAFKDFFVDTAAPSKQTYKSSSPGQSSSNTSNFDEFFT